MLTEVGPVEIAVPRDRDGSFEPQIVKKRQRRLAGVEDMVLSLSAKGLTTGEISAHLAEVYGADVSRQTISTITDKVIEGMTEWQNRPLDRGLPGRCSWTLIHVKIRDGKVANRPIYVALAVTVEGTRDILGLWAGDGGEGAKFWLQVLTELRNRGVGDVCMVVCDGLKGLPEAIEATWPAAVTPDVCDPPAPGLVPLRRPAALGRHRQGTAARLHRPDRGRRQGTVRRVHRARGAASTRRSSGSGNNAWAEFVPFLAFDAEIRKVVCSTNAIESVNARIRRAVRARGHFPNEQAALKCVYLAVMSLDPTGQGRRRWTMRWKPALNAFEMTFEGRLSAGRK